MKAGGEIALPSTGNDRIFIYHHTFVHMRPLLHQELNLFYSSKTSSSSQDWLLNFLFPNGMCCLLAICSDTIPCLMFLKTAMACPWVIPCSTCPLIERISSPESETRLDFTHNGIFCQKVLTKLLRV